MSGIMSAPTGTNEREESASGLDRNSKTKPRALTGKMKKKFHGLTEQDLEALRSGRDVDSHLFRTSDGTKHYHAGTFPVEKHRRPFFRMNGGGEQSTGAANDHFYEEKFFVNGHDECGSPPKEGIIREGTFAGRRDVLNPQAIDEQALMSVKGTVRGFKNRVRAGIATFLLEDHAAEENNYRVTERGKIVIYTTSMSIIRGTFEQCRRVKNLIQNHMVRYEERDVYMNKDLQRELVDRMQTEEVEVPQVFADGVLIGGAKKIEQLNETGELRTIFKHFKKISVKSNCSKCGGYRFVPCSSCHGSKKSFYRNNFTDTFHSLRCMQCNENALVRCDLCIDQQE